MRSASREGLFDDVVGSGWCLVACDPAVPDQLAAAERDAWHALGGRVAIVGQQDTGTNLLALDGTYAARFADNACSAAIVRPDWYLYGTAQNGEELSSLLKQLRRALQPRPALVA